MDLISNAFDNFGLTIRVKETEVMFQSVPRKPYPNPRFQTMARNPVDKFIYFSSKLALSSCLY